MRGRPAGVRVTAAVAAGAEGVAGPGPRGLRRALAPFARRSTATALALFSIDLCVYAAAVLGAARLDDWFARAPCALVAGIAIAALFVVGHDAAHGAYTDSRRLNAIVGHIAFLPTLHNFRLWQIVHNRWHHRTPNLKGRNSWSPMSKAEFDAAPPARRWLERLYRSPAGLGVYYLAERWWRDKLFPSRRVAGTRRALHWVDFALVAGYAGVLGGVLWNAGGYGALLWGGLVPFALWNHSMGFTVYLQHTSPRLPWFATRDEWRRLGGQEDVTAHVAFPRWYGLASHDIMEHTAHHVHPKIPLYNIRRAQDALGAMLGERYASEPFSPARFLEIMRRCKLYDYERHRWLDFRGEPTAAPIAAPVATAPHGARA